MARALAQRWRLKLHLLGTSPLSAIDPAWRSLDAAGLKQLKAQVAQQARGQGESPQEAWARIEKSLEIERNLAAYRTAGVDVTYHSCNVADRQELAAVLDKVRGSGSPIEGILHGAGLEAASRFSRKQLAMVDRVVGAKVDGAAALVALTSNDPVKHFIGFGSSAGRLGGIGQTDYAMSNDALAKIVSRLRGLRPECHAVTFQWGPWDEVGMAARPESRFALKAMNLAFMPPQEGVQHVVGELERRAGETEILIVDSPGGPLDGHVTMPPAEVWPLYGARRELAAQRRCWPAFSY